MIEQTFIELEFDKVIIPAEELGSPNDCYYYRRQIGETVLITNTDDEAVEEGWWASILELVDLRIKGSGDLTDLIRILELNTV